MNDHDEERVEFFLNEPHRDTEIERIAPSDRVSTQYRLGFEDAKATILDILRSQPASEPSLDVAWKAAEAALAEPGIVQLTGTTTGIADPYIAIALDQFASRPFAQASGSTPAAALQALAARLSQPADNEAAELDWKRIANVPDHMRADNEAAETG